MVMGTGCVNCVVDTIADCGKLNDVSMNDASIVMWTRLMPTFMTRTAATSSDANGFRYAFFVLVRVCSTFGAIACKVYDTVHTSLLTAMWLMAGYSYYVVL